MASALATRSTTAARGEWFETWFDSTHYHRLYGARDEREAATLIDAVVARLGLDPGAEVLDLGCGAGRHARQLHAQGFRVTGLDLSAGSITAARRFERDGLRFARHDMRTPFGTNRFEGVFSFFTSFGYFDTSADDRTVVHNMARSLRPNGQLVLDYLNVHPAEAHITPWETTVIDGVTYRLTRWSDRRHFFKRIEIDGRHINRPLEYVERVAKYGVDDFRRMFAAHGLEIEATFGDYALGPYEATTSPRLILVARRRRLADDALPDAA